MADTSCELLSLTTEPALVAQRGTVMYANPSALHLFGADCIGKKTEELFGSDLPETPSRSCVSGVSIDGRTYVLRMSPLENRQVFFLTPQAKTFDLANDAFLYSLRSNMSAFSLANERATALAEERGQTDICSCLQTMTRSYYKTSRLVRNISVVHDAVSGTLPCVAKVFDLGELCSAAVDTFSRFCGSENISFSCSGEMPVSADPELTELMFFNILSNALIHAGGRTRVKVSLRRSGDSVLLYVSDDGCGIPAELLPRVFERYRYGFELSEISGGAGFGLSAALHIAMQHGGTILLESREGVGTTVCVSMPCSDALCVEDAEPYTFRMEDLLVGLADCLPEECFGAGCML